MKVFTNNLQLIFKLSNICLIILYLYPGSILGFFLFNDFSNQPQITRDFFQISSNHSYAFSLISILGLFAFKTKKKIICIFGLFIHSPGTFPFGYTKSQLSNR